MKKIVIVFGSISGFIVTAMMVYAASLCYTSAEFESSMVLGYAAMILAFSLIFVGIKNFRDKHNEGVITFGNAFKIGLYITLIASTMYVVVWLIDYYLFIPDFMDKYSAHMLKEAEAGGATQPELETKAAEMADFKEMYQNPVFVVLITYSEIIPVGLVVSLIGALILKRKSRIET